MNNEISTSQLPQNIEIINPNEAIFNNEKLNQLSQFANMMAKGKCTVPSHLSGNPGDCLAITMQAAQWGMNPFAVAQKTHLVNGVLGYEAQLINAVISSSQAIQGRFYYEYGGDWATIAGVKSKNEKNQKGSWVTKKGWSDDQETGLFIRVGATINGEKEITWLENLYFKSVGIRNSPLWVSDPKQQIAYLAVKKWSRLYTPAVILGVYTSDEIEKKEPRDITPVADASDLNNKLSGNTAIESNVIHYSIDDFKNDLNQSTSQAEIKKTLENVGKLSASDKPEARRVYKTRIEELKETVKPSAAFTSAMEALEMSETIKELIQASEIAIDIKSAKEADRFQVAFDAAELAIKGSSNE